MIRPATDGPPPSEEASLEIADILRRYGADYARRHPELTPQQHLTLRRLIYCRTEELGGHWYACRDCQTPMQAYNACYSRHCAKCSGPRRAAWYEKRAAEMLPVPYYHAVFTVPQEIAQLAKQNPILIYNTLFYAISQALLRTAKEVYGIKLGFIVILHSWGQLLYVHPHGHVLLPGGGLWITGEDGELRWVSLPEKEPLPREQLRETFQKLFLKRLKRLYRQRLKPLRPKSNGKLPEVLQFRGDLAYLQSPEEFEKWHRALAERRWVIYLDKADVSVDPQHPEYGQKTLKYLARYVKGVPISNHRLLKLENDEITFKYKDYRDGGARKEMTLPAEEFVERFMDHILPRGFQSVRHYGYLHRADRAETIAAIRQQLQPAAPVQPIDTGETTDKSWEEISEELEQRPALERPGCKVCGCQVFLMVGQVERPRVPEILQLPLNPDAPQPSPARQRRFAFEYS